MKTPDLTYTTSGMFTRFIPETTQGETAWKEMEAQGGAQVLAIHAAAVIQQLRKAGYSVAKARKVKAGEINAILKELVA